MGSFDRRRMPRPGGGVHSLALARSATGHRFAVDVGSFPWVGGKGGFPPSHCKA